MTVTQGKALVLPIPLPLLQYLEDAIDRSPSEYVFPGTDGKRLPEHTKMEQVFRASSPSWPRRRVQAHLPPLDIVYAG